MTAPTCVECDRPVADGAPLCTTCGERTEKALLDVPYLLDELAITRAGLGRNSPPATGARGGGEIPLPIRSVGTAEVWNPVGAMLQGDRDYHRINNTVTTWTRALAEDLAVTPVIGGLALIAATNECRRRHTDDRTGAALEIAPPTPLAQAAVWLARHRHELRAHEAAPELLRDITRAVGSLTKLVDRPVELRYLGACPAELPNGKTCGYELRVQVDDDGRVSSFVRCRRNSCRMQYEVADIEAKARELAEKQCYTVTELVRMTAAIGAPIPERTLYHWAHGSRRLEPRGWRHEDDYGVRITDRQIGPRDRQVYRLGDALELARRAERRGGSAA